ncbi:hypothetical protein EUX98_g6928 [Antrodiella citrinella]|uniref:Uncharacterized protein n=1 Tax=Antrodiella citrinella TaxID=2447956 RepID=A0A4S4MN34_9APHY|nr:hypothetical protein EUX98_g6928 [Antrodiella citrinella]
MIPGNIKAIVLDVHALVDRDGPLQDALTSLFPPSVHAFSPSELLSLYVEHETLRRAEGTKRGIRIIQQALPSSVMDNTTRNIVSSIPGVSSSLLDAQDGVWGTGGGLLSLCQKRDPTVSANEVLVVTSDLVGVTEQAGRAGRPTAFIRRAGSRNANVRMRIMSPAYSIADLDALLPIVADPSAAPAPEEPVTPVPPWYMLWFAYLVAIKSNPS